jgi:hypothetical protein
VVPLVDYIRSYTLLRCVLGVCYSEFTGNQRKKITKPVNITTVYPLLKRTSRTIREGERWGADYLELGKKTGSVIDIGRTHHPRRKE